MYKCRIFGLIKLKRCFVPVERYIITSLRAFASVNNALQIGYIQDASAIVQYVMK